MSRRRHAGRQEPEAAYNCCDITLVWLVLRALCAWLQILVQHVVCE